MSLTGKVAIVTGSSRGIGAATAELLASHGANVVVNYLQNKDAANHIVETIQAAGGHAISVRADVQDEQQIANLVDQTLATFGGRIDILVSNAPADHIPPKPIAYLSWPELLQSASTELKAAYVLTRAVLPSMQNQHYGRIVYTASGLAKRPGFPGSITIGIGKANVIAFAKYVAQEFGAFGITANTISPGLVETEMTANMASERKQMVAALTPVGRLAQPKDIARVIAFLADESSGFITGTDVPVSGGLVMD